MERIDRIQNRQAAYDKANAEYERFMNRPSHEAHNLAILQSREESAR